MTREDDRDANARLDTHEAVCAERYAAVSSRLKRMESGFLATGAAVIGLLMTVLLTLLTGVGA